MSEFNLDKKADILQATFKHYFDMAMDHHTKAGTTSNILLIIVGAIITIIGFEETRELADMGGGIGIFIVGFFGAIWVRKQHERYFYWQTIAYEYQKELAKIIPNFKTGEEYYAYADKEADKEGFRFIRKVPDRYLWVFLHCIVAIIGLSVFILNLVVYKCPA